MAQWLTPHFSLEELTTTELRGLENRPPPEVVENLRRTALALEAVRTLLGDRPILVSSGYRSPDVNRRVGGAANSAHMSGQAVDFTCWSFGDPAEICRTIAGSAIEYDQLIDELTWCHIGFGPRRRGQVLRRRGGRYLRGLDR